MYNKFNFIVVMITIIIIVLISRILVDARNTYIELGEIKTELAKIESEFNHYHTLVQIVNDIDNKFTQELTNEKAENINRFNNVINHVARLQLNVNNANTKNTATTTGMDDAKTCQLTGEARQNYYLLRDDIITKDKMILGLQNYIRDICLPN